MAAHRMHIKTVIFPKRNEKDLADVPRDVQRDLDLVLVERMDEIIGRALLEAQPVRSRAKPRPRRPRKKADEAAAAPVEGGDASHDGAAAPISE